MDCSLIVFDENVGSRSDSRRLEMDALCEEFK